jgi:hypothetical protein
MSNPVSNAKASGTLFSAELVEAQGRSDREYLTTRVKLLLDVKEKYPSASFADISQLADVACGQGCCCCCNTLALGADVINPAPRV